VRQLFIRRALSLGGSARPLGFTFKENVMKNILLVILIVVVFSKADSQSFNIRGKWRAIPNKGVVIRYNFIDTVKVVWSVIDPTDKSGNFNAKYSLRRGNKYWEIDIYDFDIPDFKQMTFRGIIEVISANKFKMEVMPSPKGLRPEKFTGQALVFSKLK
jgi:hypothetical protein